MSKSLDPAARIAAMKSHTVKVGELEFHPIVLTTVARREQKKKLTAIRRASQQAEDLDAEVVELEDARKYDEADEKQAQVDELEERAERLTCELIAAQLRDEQGDAPAVEDLMDDEKLPSFMRGEVFEFISQAMSKPEGEADPQTGTPTGSTSS